MMLKQGLHGMLAAGLVVLTGCGPTVDDVIGTWTYEEGSLQIIDCGDYGATETDLSGEIISFSAGTTNDLVSGEGDCLAGFSFDGNEIRATGYEGSGCTGDEGALPEGYTTTGEVYWVYSAEGDVSKLTPTGSVSITGNDITCVGSYSGALIKN